MISNDTIKLLRIPFSVFLSPLYFFALSQVPEIHWSKAGLIFLILHFLIYPASNGYNSYMDRDTESIGGIEKPPLPSRQLFLLTIILDVVAILASFLVYPLFAILILFYIGASKTYSFRGTRFKKYAIISYFIVIIFQGALTFALVYSGSGTNPDFHIPWQGMIICALLVGGFYPLTQIYQHKQDIEDGVVTISYKLGYTGTFIFCAINYMLSWIIMTQFFLENGEENKLVVISLFFLPIIVYFIWWFLQVKKNSAAASFKNTMRMNWLAAICTNTAFIILLIWKWFE